jgi:Domain of unknown function (DUF1330)
MSWQNIPLKDRTDFPGIQPNSDHRDHSRLSCGAGETQLRPGSARIFRKRFASSDVLEGQWQNPRTVIIEFPTREAAEAWYKSPDYQKIIDLRLKSTCGNLIILDGM